MTYRLCLSFEGNDISAALHPTPTPPPQKKRNHHHTVMHKCIHYMFPRQKDILSRARSLFYMYNHWFQFFNTVPPSITIIQLRPASWDAISIRATLHGIQLDQDYTQDASRPKSDSPKVLSSDLTGSVDPIRFPERGLAMITASRILNVYRHVRNYDSESPIVTWITHVIYMIHVISLFTMVLSTVIFHHSFACHSLFFIFW